MTINISVHIICWIVVLCTLCIPPPVRAGDAYEHLWKRAGSILKDANYCTATLPVRRRVQQRQDQEIASNAVLRKSHYHQQPYHHHEANLVNRVKFWPPWPLNLVLERDDEKTTVEDTGIVTAANTYPSSAAMFWAYFKERTRIGIRQCKEVCSTLYFHLPPALPPFVLLASIPQRVIVEEGVSRNMIPLLSNPFARTIALSGLGFAVMSWAHMELHRKRKLTPLLIPHQESVSKVFLPPFLPQEEAEPEIDALESSASGGGEESLNDVKNSSGKSIVEETYDNLLNPKLRKHLADLYESVPKPDRSFPSVWKEWKRSRALRKRESAKVRRATIFDELVALQAIKRKSERLRRNVQGKKGGESKAMGYALVTGASQGIGRAIAVELARWEIPAVLVARDVDKLISLAYDLEACYGVKCIVLPADLSKKDAAEKIHKTTSDNGIVVDILVNNAGIALEGLSVDTSTSDLERMIMLNTMTYAKLSCLYGQDMKKRKRGRILMVSSMAGLTSAAPNTAYYGATKAFGKSLSLSMAREMEDYGVGVTCLMPGAVKTDFRERSGMKKALCWYLPSYPRPADVVAHLGVTSVLDGDTQVIPGWQNRFFAQIMKPILPQRIETICVQTAFSPLKIPRFLRFGRKKQNEETDKEGRNAIAYSPGAGPSNVHTDLKPRYNMQPAPRLLKIPEEEPTPEEPKSEESKSEEPKSEEPQPSSVLKVKEEEEETSAVDIQETDKCQVSSSIDEAEKEKPGTNGESDKNGTQRLLDDSWPSASPQLESIDFIKP